MKVKKITEKWESERKNVRKERALRVRRENLEEQE